MACRSQIRPIIKFLREFVPGFGNCFLLGAASAVGVRETRHFQGEYTLTEDDILEAKTFPDWAVTGAHFNFDIHRLDGSGLDPSGMQRKFPQSRPFTIPYGCLVPKKVEGLLLAGRCISGTHKAHSAFRVMPICANIGQAAGTAAALCARQGVLPRNLPVADLQAALARQGIKP